jgi:hypothetical protein
LTRHHTVEIDERRALPHHIPKTTVIWMSRVGSTIAVSQQSTLGDKSVRIWPLATFFRRGSPNRQGYFEKSGFEDSLRCDEGHPVTFELETLK